MVKGDNECRITSTHDILTGTDPGFKDRNVVFSQWNMPAFSTLAGAYCKGGEVIQPQILNVQSAEFAHSNACVAQESEGSPIPLARDCVLVREFVEIQEDLAVGNILGDDLLGSRGGISLGLKPAPGIIFSPAPVNEGII